MVEHLLPKQAVAGSNPVSRSKIKSRPRACFFILEREMSKKRPRRFFAWASLMPDRHSFWRSAKNDHLASGKKGFVNPVSLPLSHNLRQSHSAYIRKVRELRFSLYIDSNYINRYLYCTFDMGQIFHHFFKRQRSVPLHIWIIFIYRRHVFYKIIRSNDVNPYIYLI